MGEIVFIGLGLWDELDITLKGLKEARSCDTVFAEFYTAKLVGTNKEKIEKMIGKQITILKREEVENDSIIQEARNKKIGFIVPGDPMSATTHVALRLKAIEEGISTKIIHGTSIVTASAGILGLQIYKFGRITTMPFPKKGYFPSSPYNVIKENVENGLHSLVLLDISDKPMTANEGIKILLKIEEGRKEGIVTDKTLIAVVARLSSPNPLARAGFPKQLLKEDFGGSPHSLVIPGKLHFMESQALIKFAGAPKNIGQ